MFIPAESQIRKVMELKGYRVYENPEGHDLNIIGIRSQERLANRFDDLLVVMARRGSQWGCWYFPCTTDPGCYWLKHPMSPKGCGIFKPGQYKGAYHIGMHQGRYEALCQKGPITVVRDFNRDDILDLDSGIEESGLFGANIHCAAYKGESVSVDKWSSMCQVVANWWDFQIFLEICLAAAQRFGNSFTYTLLEEQDFGIL